LSSYRPHGGKGKLETSVGNIGGFGARINRHVVWMRLRQSIVGRPAVERSIGGRPTVERSIGGRSTVEGRSIEGRPAVLNERIVKRSGCVV